MRTSRRCATGASSAYDVAGIVWAGDGLGFHEQRFALVEALSHLERLEAEGRAHQAAAESVVSLNARRARTGSDPLLPSQQEVP